MAVEVQLTTCNEPPDKTTAGREGFTTPGDKQTAAIYKAGKNYGAANLCKFLDEEGQLDRNDNTPETSQEFVKREAMACLNIPLPSKGLGKDFILWWKDNEWMFLLLGMVACNIISM